MSLHAGHARPRLHLSVYLLMPIAYGKALLPTSLGTYTALAGTMAQRTE